MKCLFSLLILVFSFSTFASDEVVAQMKFYESNGQKVFGAQWFEKSQVGVINMGLIWSPYTVEVKEGFKLGEAKSVTFVSPTLPDGCTVKSLKGNLNWIENGVSSISITLTGPICASVFNILSVTPIEIIFSDVPHSVSSEVTPQLDLKVIDLP
jgi:hypothetical protein